SLPKVPDSKQEEEASKRQYTTHNDRLSDDDDDNDVRRLSPLVHGHSQNRNSVSDHKETKSSKGKKGLDNSQRQWNVPDEEWEWSDDESSLSSSNTRTTRPPSLVPAVHSKNGASQSPISRIPKASPKGAEVVHNGEQQQDTNLTTGIFSSHISTPESQKTPSKPVLPVSQPEMSPPSSVAQDLCISICDSGRYIVCASKKAFAILQRSKDAIGAQLTTRGKGQDIDLNQQLQEWILIGQGSGIDTPMDGITTVLCLPLYVPRSSKRLQVGNDKNIQRGEDEDEMTILHEGGKVVCIEGESLWVVLRLSNSSSITSDGVQSNQAPTFAYKKWSLQNQDLLVDIVSCGPARRKPTLSNGYSSSSSSSMYTSQATERFVSVGSKPMIAFYASSSSSRPLLSATSLATQMAARVTSAVFGFAKSIWGSSPSPRPGSPSLGNTNGRAGQDQKRISGQGQHDGASGPYGNIYSSAMAPATEVPAVLWLSDSQRCIRNLSLAPAPPRGSCYHYPSKLAAMTDSLGRVLLVDLEECEIIRMWKGLRGARCGWVQQEIAFKTPLKNGEENQESWKRYLVLYLVIYAPKRGTVEIYPARQGKRVGLIQVGLGWKICTTFTSPIGKPVLLDRIAGTPKFGISLGKQMHDPGSPLLPENESLGLSQCLLIGPSGEVKCVKPIPVDNLNSPPKSEIGQSSPTTNFESTSFVIDDIK
ncbi:Rab3 GTPase-activating protein non-catalytic subunit, partial [Entomortierella beljakovae]